MASLFFLLMGTSLENLGMFGFSNSTQYTKNNLIRPNPYKELGQPNSCGAKFIMDPSSCSNMNLNKKNDNIFVLKNVYR